MGEVIVFKLEKNGTHLRPPPEGSAKIFFFTGVWQEPMNDQAGTSDPHRVWEKQALSRLKLGNGLKFGCAGGALAVLTPPRRSEAPAAPPRRVLFCPAIIDSLIDSRAVRAASAARFDQL